jgi:hypothetical protein
MGLILVSERGPTPSGMADGSDDGLASVVNVDMFYSHCLFATAAELGKGFDLGRVGA